MTEVLWNLLRRGSLSPRKRSCGCLRSRFLRRGRSRRGWDSLPPYSRSINRRKNDETAERRMQGCVRCFFISRMDSNSVAAISASASCVKPQFIRAFSIARPKCSCLPSTICSPPTKCDAHLTKSIFKTRSNNKMKIKFASHLFIIL